MSRTPTPDPSWRNLPSWLFFALLVIGPPAALVTFARSLTDNYLLMGSVIVGYEVLIFLFRFVGKLWQPLEKFLIDHIAGWMTLRAQERISKYYKHYSEHIVYEHQVFDVKGLSTRTAHDLELEKVFVDLRLDPTAPHQTSPDPLRLPEHLRQGAHSMWEYLEIAHKHLVIVGAPGSGKTTLLKHLALTLAQPKKYPRRTALRQSFPILLFLRDHTQSIIGDPNFSLIQAVQNHVQRKWQQDLPSTWLSRYLAKGMCLILLDGLDEVAEATMRLQVAAWVQRQMVAYGNNRFVLTSRPYGYRDNSLEGVMILQVQSFTPDQVEQFVQNWYLANEAKSWEKEDPGVHLRAREGAQDLLRRLRQASALLDLAINPLLLTMIATVHRERASLPGKRVALYAEICDVFLGKRREALGIAQNLSPAQNQQVLQPLAYCLMQQGVREISAEEAGQVITSRLASVSTQMSPADFLHLAHNMSGLLLERNPGFYGFAHLTFQEYLAAAHIKEEGLEQYLVAQVANSWWHETIRLYCAQADATALIMACLAGSPPSVDVLTLAFECDEEKLKIQPEAQKRLNEVLETGLEDPEPERRHILAEALLTRRLRRMVHLRGQTYVDTELVTCAEYQLFLDEQRKQDIYCQPDHWLATAFSPGQGRSPVLGVRYADSKAFCDWLTQRNAAQWRYRLPLQNEVKDLKELYRVALNISVTTGFWVEPGTIEIQREPDVFDVLKEILKDDWDHVDGLYLTRALDGDFDLDHALARELGLDLNLALDRSKDRIPALALALVLDLARASDLADDRARDLDRVLARAYTLDFARALADDSADHLDLDRALARNHVLPLALARALDSAEELTFVSDLARNSELAHNRNFGDPRDLTSARDLARALARDLAGAENLISVSIREPIFTLYHTCMLTCMLLLALDLYVSLTEVDIRKPLIQLQQAEEARLFIRYAAMMLPRLLRKFAFLKIHSESNFLKRFFPAQHPDYQLFETAIAKYLDLACTFTLLEERIKGRLPAWEGILLVKEATTTE